MAVLRGLKRYERRALVAYLRLGDYAACAAELGVPMGTFKGALHRARAAVEAGMAEAAS